MARFILRRAAPALAAAGALALMLSCTSSGDGGVNGTNDYLDRGVTLESDLAPDPLPNVRVVLESGVDTATTSCIRIRAFRVMDVFAAAFTLSYDPAVLRYTGHDATGSCLGTGADVLPAQVDWTTTPGRIVVGLTRNAQTTTVDIDTCGYLIDLCFDVVGTGEFDMNFVGNLALLRLDGTPLAPPASSDWIGKHVVVKQ